MMRYFCGGQTRLQLRHIKIDAGLTGPTGRASGLERDIRLDAPYLAYGEYPIQLTIETDGDLKARFVVRLRE